MLESERKWYDKKRFVLPLLLFLYPIGLYSLFKGKAIENKGAKIGISIGFGLLFIISISDAIKDYDSAKEEIKRENKIQSETEKQEQKNGRKIVRSDKRKIFYGNDGTRKLEKCLVVYKVASKKDERVGQNNRRRIVEHYLFIEEFNAKSLDEDLMKEIMFDAFNLAKEEHDYLDAYFKVFMYSSKVKAVQKADDWLALLNKIDEDGVTIKYDYDRMNAFAKENAKNLKEIK